MLGDSPPQTSPVSTHPRVRSSPLSESVAVSRSPGTAPDVTSSGAGVFMLQDSEGTALSLPSLEQTVYLPGNNDVLKFSLLCSSS